MAAEKTAFLKQHRTTFIGKTRNPIKVADDLLISDCIDEETYGNIKFQKTKQKQMREIFCSLNSPKHYDCVYDSLKENEPDLVKELEMRDTEAEAPLKKRSKYEREDETDNNLTGFPASPESKTDVKRISTFPQLEKWVSEPEITQKLIGDLEEKIGEEEMYALKKELRGKQPKNSLCFNASNIDDIRKNKKLEMFLNATSDAKFPKLTFSMFFKGGSASSGYKVQRSTDYNKYMGTTVDPSSSGSFNNSLSRPSLDLKNSTLLSDEVIPTEFSHTADRDKIIDENKDNRNESKTNELMHPEEPMDMQDAYKDEMERQSQRLNVEDASQHKNESVSENKTSLEVIKQHSPVPEMYEEPQSLNDQIVLTYENDERITKTETPLEDGHRSTDIKKPCTKMDEQPQGSSVPNFPFYEDLSLCQNGSATVKERPLEDRTGSTDMREPCSNKMDEDPQRSNVPVNAASLHPNESTVINKMPLDDRENMIEGNKDNESEFSSTELGFAESFQNQNESISKSKRLPEVIMDIQDTHPPVKKKESQRLEVPNPENDEGITKTETPLEDGLGSTYMKKPCTDKLVEEPQRSNRPNFPFFEDISLYRNEPIPKKVTPLENKIGSTDMREPHSDEMDQSPYRSNVPMNAASLHPNESTVINKMPLDDRCGNMNMQKNLEQLQKNSPGSASVSTQSNSTEISLQNKHKIKREQSKYQKEKLEKEDKLLRDWAMKQCNGSKEELKKILEQISFTCLEEHQDYPYFTAENVMVYNKSLIIFISDDNTSITTQTIVHYYMFVCNINKAVLLSSKNPNQQEIQYDASKVPVDKCRNFIFKVLAPALSLYKKIQKEEKLSRLI